jgi:Smr domain
MSAFIQYQQQVLQQQQQESIIHSSRKVGSSTLGNNNINSTHRNKKHLNKYSNNNKKIKSRLIKNDNKATNNKIKYYKPSSSSSSNQLEIKVQSNPSINRIDTDNIPVLDLHGYRLEKALRAVTDFLEDNRRRRQAITFQQQETKFQDATSTSGVEHAQIQGNTEQRWHGYDDNETDGIKKDSRTRQPYSEQQSNKHRHNPSYSYHFHRKQQQIQQQLHSKITKKYQQASPAIVSCRIVTGTGSHSGMMGGPILRTAIESLLQRRQMQYSIENPGCFLVNANSGIQFVTMKTTGADTKIQIIDNNNSSLSANSTGTGHLQSFAAAAAKAAISTSVTSVSKSYPNLTKKNNKTPIKYKKKNSVVYDDDYMDTIATLKIRSLKDIQYEEELTRKEEEEFDEICRLSLLEDAKVKHQQDQEDKLFQQALQVSNKRVVAFHVDNDDDDDIDDEEEELRKAIEESMQIQQHQELLQREVETEEEVMIRRAILESEKLILDQQQEQQQLLEYNEDEEERLFNEAIRLSQLHNEETHDCKHSEAIDCMSIHMNVNQNEMINQYIDNHSNNDHDGDEVNDLVNNANGNYDEYDGQRSEDVDNCNNSNEESESSYDVLSTNNLIETASTKIVETKIDSSCCPSTTATYDEDDDASYTEANDNEDENHDYCYVVGDDEKYEYNYDNYINKCNDRRRHCGVDGQSDADGNDGSNNSDDNGSTTVYYYDEVQEKIIQDVLQMMNTIQHDSLQQKQFLPSSSIYMQK